MRPPAVTKERCVIDRGQAIAGRKGDNEIASARASIEIDGMAKAAVRRRARRTRQHILDVGSVLDAGRHYFDRERWRRGLGCPQEIVIGGGPGVGDSARRAPGAAPSP